MEERTRRINRLQYRHAITFPTAVLGIPTLPLDGRKRSFFNALTLIKK